MNAHRQAVALEYGKHSAPVVTARGDAQLAERIVAEARRRGVFIAQDPALVGLLGQLEIGEAIPPQLYAAVAAILSWAYWLRGMVPGDEKRSPPAPVDE
jgi:flagellar biosynthesis protein